MRKALFCVLPERTLVTVRGSDAATFLQSFTSVDMRKATTNQLLFGAFLNPKGRILHDFFVRKTEEENGGFDLETPKQSTNELVSYLNKFKFRKKVQIQADTSTRQVFAVWNGSDINGLPDPRAPEYLAHRLWSTELPSNAEQVSTDKYHQMRMRLGVCEGDAESFEKVPFQLNYDFFPSALSYDKGCYTGQELIARTHFKGQVRKRILPVQLDSNISVEVGSAIEPIKPLGDDEHGVGEGTLLALAPGDSTIGLASFRDANYATNDISSAGATHITKNGTKVRLVRPVWWPAPPA